jgi:hypothetical protein
MLQEYAWCLLAHIDEYVEKDELLDHDAINP